MSDLDKELTTDEIEKVKSAFYERHIMKRFAGLVADGLIPPLDDDEAWAHWVKTGEILAPRPR